jgi:hypothetical protein
MQLEDLNFLLSVIDGCYALSSSDKERIGSARKLIVSEIDALTLNTTTNKKTFKDILFALESNYPKVAEKINTMWGTLQCRQYLDDLCIDDRCDAKPRQGFPFAMLMMIEDLLDEHDAAYPNFAVPKKPWDR